MMFVGFDRWHWQRTECRPLTSCSLFTVSISTNACCCCCCYCWWWWWRRWWWPLWWWYRPMHFLRVRVPLWLTSTSCVTSPFPGVVAFAGVLSSASEVVCRDAVIVRHVGRLTSTVAEHDRRQTMRDVDVALPSNLRHNVQQLPWVACSCALTTTGDRPNRKVVVILLMVRVALCLTKQWNYSTCYPLQYDTFTSNKSSN